MILSRSSFIALCAAFATSSAVFAVPPQVQIDEILAGANGDSRIQFVELKFCCPGENLWGPQAGETQGRYRLVFYDATGAQTSQFVFPSDAPLGVVDPVNGGYSVLVATSAFASLAGMPTPDFTIPPSVIAQGGKVAFKHNPANANAEPINLCLSYGNFAGATESDTDGNPAGTPASASGILNATSLVRTTNFATYGVGQYNSNFALATASPRNSAGQTGTLAVAAQVEQGQNLFTKETFLGNGRTCSTCHRPEADFSLPVSIIATLPPTDPLFVAETNPALAALENPCLLRSRGLFLENIDGFSNPHVFRGSPHIENTAGTAPYGQSGEFADLQAFATAAVRQHFPRTLTRNAIPSAGAMDFRLPTSAELAALETFMNSITLPADGDFDLDRMITAAVQRGADASAIQRGRTLFLADAKCFLCHGGPVLALADVSLGGGNQNFNTGVVNLPIGQSEACLGGAPMPPELGGNRDFNTPALIGVSRTAPYFHNHSVQTLREAVAFYNGSEFNDSPAGLLIDGISLLESEIDDITAFLNALVEPTVSDCNSNMVDDIVDITQGTSPDCNLNNRPDECDLSGNDCNGNLIPDTCDILPVKLELPTYVPSGDGPFAVAVADLNADGYGDLVSANWIAATASVWLNNAGVGFISAGSFSVGPLGRCVTPGDFDKDGNMDVAIPSLSQAKVFVLRNKGDDGGGTWQGFAPVVSFVTGAGPLSVVAADLNSDTWLDLATADNIAGTISVLLNNGSSMGVWQGFATPVSYTAGSGPWSIAVGHLDADADLDLAVALRQTDQVRVFWNNGGGAFPTSTTAATGRTPEGVAVGDFNGDGLDDLATADFNENAVSVIRNLGGGAFAPRVLIGVGFYPFGSNPKFIVAVDMDVDGDADLVTANEFSDNVSVLVNNGAGTFNSLLNVADSDAPASLGIGNLDGDMMPDVAASHFVQDRLSCLRNLSPPFGGDCNENLVPDSCDIASGAASDFNGNNIADGCERLGDIDQNGVMDGIDVAIFVDVLLDLDTVPAHISATDVNASGAADGQDIQPFVRLFVASL